MHHYEVQDFMTADPPTVSTATPVKEVAGILVKQRVGAVPVHTQQGEIVGVVTEADLLRKEELQPVPNAGRPAHMSRQTRRDLAAAETASEIMRTTPVTVRATATPAEAARLMDRHHVTCLLAVDEQGQLLGTVTPRDLLRVFLRPDAEIRSEIIGEVLVGYFGANPALVRVDVADGVVRITGELERKSMLEFVLPKVRAVDGVIDAEAQLTYTRDDTRLPATADLTDY